MTSLTRRVTGAAAAAALALTGLGLMASPASATEPTGGCWVYSVPSGSPIEAAPASNISSMLAAWTDPAAAPAGPADYTLTTSGSTAVGTNGTLSLTFNKGPKNGGPPASGTAYYFFSVNGVNVAPVAKSRPPDSSLICATNCRWPSTPSQNVSALMPMTM